jgi:dihydropteroate synthase
MDRRIGARRFDFERAIAVMAVVNRTPDSFFDRGATFALDAAIAACLTAAEQGADWVDVGGVPFGRGPAVGTQEEIDRVVPVIEAVHRRSDVVLSVDTVDADVADAAMAAGAAVINDSSGLYDARMAAVAARTGATLVLTHSLHPPRSEPPRPEYDDVVASVLTFLHERIAIAEAAGVAPEKIVVDPGHDLNKNTFHTIELTRRLAEVAALGYPVLAAVSNKDFIGETLDRAKGDRLAGSLAAAVVCVLNGARILRMHDVRAAVDAARMTEALLGFREPHHAVHNRAAI